MDKRHQMFSIKNSMISFNVEFEAFFSLVSPNHEIASKSVTNISLAAYKTFYPSLPYSVYSNIFKHCFKIKYQNKI